MEQIIPAHATHLSCFNDKFLSSLYHQRFSIQKKYDGERMLLHFENGHFYCTSRRISKKTGKFMELQDRLPKLQKVADFLNEFGFQYIVFDCECYAKSWSEAVGVLHSLPDRAIALQDSSLNNIDIKFAIFDLLFYGGLDYRTKPYNIRFQYAKELIEIINLNIEDSSLHIVDNLTVDINKREDFLPYFDEAVNAGYEGIVAKNLNLEYYDRAAYIKIKKIETVDVVVYNYIPGRGKYTNTVGALQVGYYDEETGKIIHISNVNCGTDEDRNDWRDNWTSLKDSVIEIKCQEITDTSLRHPVYVRKRPDKAMTMCTKDTIFK